LSAMGGTINHLGPHGNGAMMKLINNFMCGVQVASLAEALGMAGRSGLDVAQAAQVLASGSPGSPLVKNISQRMVARDYSPNFFVRLMAKDLEYARSAFARAGIELASAGVARERFLEGMRAGLGERDIASIVELLRG
jgi:3-hydroxyisobutyrate dehydrogenase